MEKLESSKLITPVHTSSDLLAATERHHILVRDFHLARGVFRQRTDAERSRADNIAQQEAQAPETQNLGVMVELDKLQENKPSWNSAILILACSVLLFVSVGAARGSWKSTLWLIPVLFIHELGHWLAMRLFKYRNLRMFFIPLFGAAVTGQNWNVPGWKKALVSLAGPVPGILLGVVLGIGSIVWKVPYLSQAAALLLILNGFNLLPILPLDGGHNLQAILFCRNRWLDITFRVLAVAGLVGMSLLGFGRLFFFIAIPMALSLPLVFRVGKVTDKLRNTNLPMTAEGSDKIPSETVSVIVTELKAVLPPNVDSKALATQTLGIFETLNAKPPSALGTIALLFVHGAAVFLAVACGVTMFIAHQGGFGKFFQAAIDQAEHVYYAGAVSQWRGNDAGGGQENSPKSLLVASFGSKLKAGKAFSTLTNQLSPKCSVTLFSESLLVAMPASNDNLREKCFEQVETLSTNLFVVLSNRPVQIKLSFVAPTDAAATNITEELTEYFALPSSLRLIPPWSASANRPGFEKFRHTRSVWTQIDHALEKTQRDPRLKALDAKIQAAVQRGAEIERAKLTNERKEIAQELEQNVRRNLLKNPEFRADATVLELHSRWSHVSYTNTQERIALINELVPTFGEAPHNRAQGDAALNHDDRPRPGYALHQGLMVQTCVWLEMDEVPSEIDSLAQWLAEKKCSGIRYEFINLSQNFTSGDREESESEEE